LPTKIQNPLKTSKEVLIEESRSEQWERRINLLEGRLRLLETENSELENERKRLVDILNKQRERIKNRKNIQTQVIFKNNRTSSKYFNLRTIYFFNFIGHRVPKRYLPFRNHKVQVFN